MKVALHNDNERGKRSNWSNPPIEQTGVAGRRHGNAQISERNANYIVNLGGANASDIATLIVEAHQEVLTRHGIHLALNVELFGEWQFA